MYRVRQPAVAGAFYDGNTQTLAAHIDSMLGDAAASTAEHISPKAIIVPHAGYIYSGPVAAYAYHQLINIRDNVKRVILLGPVHRVPVRGLALPGSEAFATPLGEIPIDLDAAASIQSLPQVIVSPEAHMPEHSLEVQLPFLQTVLDDFKLLPLAVGDATPGEVAEVINTLWGGPETLIVISSDLSHFLPYDVAKMTDSETVHKILNMQSDLNHEQACGGTPVNGLLLAARQHNLHPKLLDLRNSGDTAGDKDRVVGYTSIAFTEAGDGYSGH